MASSAPITRIIGSKELQKKMRELPRKIGFNAMRAGLRAGAKLLRDAAREKAPEDTGWLKQSLTYHESQEKVNKQFEKMQRISTSARYAHLVELGHMKQNGGHHPAHPFMRPAFLEKKEAMVKALEVKIKERLDKIVKGAA